MQLRKEFTPMKHQRELAKWAWGRAKQEQGSAIFGEVGTGKTLIGLMTGLAVSGKTVLYVTTAFLRADVHKKVSQYFEDIDSRFFRGKRKILKKKIKPIVTIDENYGWEYCGMEDARILIVNYEFLASEHGKIPNFKRLKQMFDYDVMIIDESHRIKDPTTLWFKAVSWLAIGKIVVPMTGTPVGNGYWDLWAPMFLIRAEGCPDNWWKFQKLYCIMGGFKNRQIVKMKPSMKKAWLDIVKANSKSVLTKDVLDLPEKMFDNKYYEMSEAHTEQYKTFKKKQVMRALEEKLVVNNRLSLMLYLQALVSGWMPIRNVDPKKKSEFKELHNERFDFAMEILEGLDKKTLVWCRFTESANKLQRLLGNRALSLTGETSDPQAKLDIINKFKGGDYRYLIINIGIAEGYDVNEAKYAVYFENDFSNLKKTQTQGRNQRPGQTESVTEINIVCLGTIDESIMAALNRKRGEAEDMMDDVKFIFEKEIK